MWIHRLLFNFYKIFFEISNCFVHSDIPFVNQKLLYIIKIHFLRSELLLIFRNTFCEIKNAFDIQKYLLRILEFLIIMINTFYEIIFVILETNFSFLEYFCAIKILFLYSEIHSLKWKTDFYIQKQILSNNQLKSVAKSKNICICIYPVWN